MLGKIEGRKRKGRQRMRWLDGIINSMDMSLSKLRDSEGQGSLVCCSPWGRKELNMTRQLEKAMATHSRTLAWKIPRTEEPGRLQSMGSLRVGHDCATSLSLSCIGEGNGNPLQCSCLENPRDRGAWWEAIYGVAQSQTRLKRLSKSMRHRDSVLSRVQLLRPHRL